MMTIAYGVSHVANLAIHAMMAAFQLDLNELRLARKTMTYNSEE
jgi:hypothetical protein